MPPSDVTGAAGFHGFMRTWQAMSAATIAGVRATNHALLAPLQASAAMANGTADHDRLPAASIPALAYEREDWPFERTVDDVEAITVGDTVRFTKRLTDEDVTAFADASGDTNRLHLDDDYAEATRFGGRIVHGTLVAGLLSAALARLPGLTIYLSQTVEFIGPVAIGETVTAVVEVVEDLGTGQYRLSTVIENADGEHVVEGEAVVLIDPVDA